MKISNALKLIGAIFICQLAGVVGSLFTYRAIPLWYASLAKPPFNPPNWIFGPVWLTLYTLMGISAFIVWTKGWERREVKTAIYVFAGQLVLNALWSVIFFGLRSPLYAFIGILVLWLFIILTVYYFYKISKAAGLLLLPYLLWVSFAAVLNLSIAILNA